jgi:group I intron endonuclease
MLKSGIYAIAINKKWYVGSAINFKNRRHSHKKKLNTNKHPNKHLQSAYNKYQEFEFRILEYCEPEKILEREEWWIEWTDCCNPEKGYNKRRKPNSNLGLKMSAETRAKHSARLKGHKFNVGRVATKEQREKQSALMKGRPKPYFRNLEKWPCPDGNKCNCEVCKNKRNEIEKLRLLNVRRANGIMPLRNTEKWPHEKGCLCKCEKCKQKRSERSLEGWHKRKLNKFCLTLGKQIDL